MYWNRREFLKIFTAAAAAPAIFAALPLPEWEVWQQTPAFAQQKLDEAVKLVYLSAEPRVRDHRVHTLEIARPDGQPLLGMHLNGASQLVWMANPGNEIICTTGLLNKSDADLSVYMHFRQGRRGWAECDGKIVEMSL
jgi:hypothetical protein